MEVALKQLVSHVLHGLALSHGATPACQTARASLVLIVFLDGGRLNHAGLVGVIYIMD